MLTPFDRKIDELVGDIPELIKKFSYRKGPDLYFYRKTWSFVEANRFQNYWKDQIDSLS